MSESSNVSVIERLYGECIDRDQFEMLSELLTEDVVQHFGLSENKGLAAFESAARRVRGMFPDGKFVVDGVVSNGDQAAAHWTMKATHTVAVAGVAPTGKPIVNHGVVFYRFKDGKIAEIWLEVDQAGVLRQIGVEIPGGPVPAPSPKSAA